MSIEKQLTDFLSQENGVLDPDDAPALAEAIVAHVPGIAAHDDMLAALLDCDVAFATLNIGRDHGITPQADGAMKTAWAKATEARAKATGRPNIFAEANPGLIDKANMAIAAPKIYEAMVELMAIVECSLDDNPAWATSIAKAEAAIIASTGNRAERQTNG